MQEEIHELECPGEHKVGDAYEGSQKIWHLDQSLHVVGRKVQLAQKITFSQCHRGPHFNSFQLETSLLRVALRLGLERQHCNE